MIKTHKDSTTEEFKPLRLIQSLVYLYYMHLHLKFQQTEGRICLCRFSFIQVIIIQSDESRIYNKLRQDTITVQLLERPK